MRDRILPAMFEQPIFREYVVRARRKANIGQAVTDKNCGICAPGFLASSLRDCAFARTGLDIAIRLRIRKVQAVSVPGKRNKRVSLHAQVGQLIISQNALDGVVNPVADDMQINIIGSLAVVDKRRERRIDFDRIKIAIEFPVIHFDNRAILFCRLTIAFLHLSTTRPQNVQVDCL